MNAADLADLTEAQSAEEVWALHVAKMAEFGFDRLLYGYTRIQRPNALGSPEDHFILSNHDSEFIKEFLGNHLYYHAPMVRWSLQNDGACSWSWVTEQLENGRLSPEELKVVEFNKKMEANAGYSISFKNVSHRSQGGMGLTARRGITQKEVDDMWAERGREISALCNVVHLKLTNLPYIGHRTLTKRQREALEWAGGGKTMADIALIMGLTPATVEKHLRLARKALDVDTTTQAVLKASFQNQIFVLEN